MNIPIIFLRIRTHFFPICKHLNFFTLQTFPTILHNFLKRLAINLTQIFFFHQDVINFLLLPLNIFWFTSCTNEILSFHFTFIFKHKSSSHKSSTLLLTIFVIIKLLFNKYFDFNPKRKLNFHLKSRVNDTWNLIKYF